jgi:hypothetical protein
MTIPILLFGNNTYVLPGIEPKFLKYPRFKKKKNLISPLDEVVDHPKNFQNKKKKKRFEKIIK